jgi:hypothetical protein
MTRIYALLSIAFMASCGGNKNDDSKAGPASALNSSGNPYTDIGGVYQDTLPCADCPGTLTELTLHPDSTFVLREKMLNAEGRPAKSINTRGVFSFVEGSSKIKLTSSQAEAMSRMFEVTTDGMVATDVQAQAGADLTLEIRERIIGKVGGEFISYRIADKGAYPSVVFTHMPGGDIVINKPAIDRMKDAEKAVLAYYAMQYNTGCENESCALENAMNADKSSLEANVRKWMPAVSLPSEDDLRASRLKTKLIFLNLNLQGNKLSVNYSTMTADYTMGQSTDLFEISEAEVKMIDKGTINEQKRQLQPNAEAVRERK